jgi:upstream activation factor subunit UAF30
MARFDKIQQKQAGTNGAGTVDGVPEPAPTVNGTAGTAHPPKTESEEPSEPASPTKRKVSDDEELSDVVDSPPPKKAKKVSKSVAETDEELAKRMQAELNASARSTRGGGTTKRKTVTKKAKSTPKKKSKAKINSDDDSNVSDSEKPEKEKKGGFHKPMILSPPLSEMLGETQLSRPQTVKKIWAYVKARELQDPSDKRQIRCDDAMRAVFKQDRVHMFTMNKLLAAHLYAADE